MNKNLFLFWLIFHTINIHSSCSQKNRHQRSIVFPLRSLYGLFVAIALPIDLPNKNVFMSYNFEGNYYLPFNTSELGDMAFLAPITEIRQKRQLTRRVTYKILEEKLKRSGFPGRSCLLRTICEASETQMNVNGVLGDILQIILMPSSSENEHLPISFYKAEKLGKHGDCSEYKTICPKSFLDSISKIL